MSEEENVVFSSHHMVLQVSSEKHRILILEYFVSIEQYQGWSANDKMAQEISSSLNI
jgi:hypothetical protein